MDKALAAGFHEVIVEPDAISIFKEFLRTAAGVTARLDRAQALVEQDFDVEITRCVAAKLVMFFKRDRGQLQSSWRGVCAPLDRSTLLEVQRWIAAHPAEAHGV